MSTLRFLKFPLVLVFTMGAYAQTSARRPLHHRDYDGWRAIQSQALPRDGKFLDYALFPEEGDGELMIRNLTSGKEVRGTRLLEKSEVPVRETCTELYRIVLTQLAKPR